MQTHCQRRGQEVNFLNELLPPSLPFVLCIFCPFIRRSAGAWTGFFFGRAAVQMFPQETKHLRESKAEEARRARKKTRKRGSGEEDILSHSRRPDYCHTGKTTSVPPLPFKKDTKQIQAHTFHFSSPESKSCIFSASVTSLIHPPIPCFSCSLLTQLFFSRVARFPLPASVLCYLCYLAKQQDRWDFRSKIPPHPSWEALFWKTLLDPLWAQSASFK